MPSALAFLFIGDAIAGVLLQHGRFSRTDSLHTWAILAGSAFGLVASALARLYSSTFYALRDTRTPLWFAVARVVLTGVLGYLFAYPLPAMLGLPAWTGAAGLTASAGIAGWVEFYLLRRAIGLRIGRTGMPRGQLAKLWGSGIVAGLCSLGVMRVLPRCSRLRGRCARHGYLRARVRRSDGRARRRRGEGHRRAGSSPIARTAHRAVGVYLIMAVPDAILDKIPHLPESPGVYLWRDADGKVLYVGKAKRLRSRVRSYVAQRPWREREDARTSCSRCRRSTRSSCRARRTR